MKSETAKVTIEIPGHPTWVGWCPFNADALKERDEIVRLLFAAFAESSSEAKA